MPTPLVYSSTTLATPQEREVTLRARELALDAGVRVCFDPNIRPNRWGGEVEPAAQASRELIEGSYLVRTNLEESKAITGADDPRAGRGAARGDGRRARGRDDGARGRGDPRRLRGGAARA